MNCLHPKRGGASQGEVTGIKTTTVIKSRIDESHQEWLDFLIKLQMQPGVMAYPEFERPFVLHVNVSSGAVIYQKQGGK